MNTTFENCTLLDTKTWFEKARPKPSAKDFSTQTGVHLEEVSEFVAALEGQDARTQVLLQNLADMLEKVSDHLKENPGCIFVADEVEALDAICDQVVTGVGVAHCLNFDIVGAMNEVNRSNFSKFDENGNPIYDANKKVMKGPNYTKPNLFPFIPIRN